MTKKAEHLVAMALMAAAIGGMEWWFFRAPDLARPAGASEARATGAPAGRGHAKPAEPAADVAAPAATEAEPADPADPLRREGEKHLRNVKQLTFGGENAEAYWSFDSTRLIMQSTRDGAKADQIYIQSADGGPARMVSTGKGRCTCSYFFKGDKRILFASTHLGGDEPPAPPDPSLGYLWGVFPTYDIFTAKPDGTDLKRLTDTPGYDAEGTVSPDGKKIVFTSMRDGDLDLYSMDIDGKNVKRLTNELGYDGGAFYSPDSKLICYRANHPQTPAEQKTYKDFLAKDLVKPTKMELFIMNADGSNKRQVTHNGAANFCPFFMPDGKRLIFASNLGSQGETSKGAPPNFELYLINLDGSGLEQVTFEPSFDGFPMISPNGKRIAWASNRHGKVRGETDIFVADWVP